MINEYISTGSVFLSGAFASLLYPPKQFELTEEELQNKTDLALEIVRDNKRIDAPLIMNKLNCDAKTANKIINRLLNRGIVTQIEE